MKYITLLVFSFFTFSAFAQDNEALIKACGAGDMATIKKNVEGGANVNFKNAGGATPISSAWAGYAKEKDTGK